MEKKVEKVQNAVAITALAAFAILVCVSIYTCVETYIRYFKEVDVF